MLENNKTTLMPYLITYPRSGSHFLVKIFYEKTGIDVGYSHEINNLFDKQGNKIKTAITIARNPIDSVKSYIALERNYNIAIDQNLVNHGISQYVLLYDFLYNYADYVIDYNDLISQPEAVLDKLIDELQLEDNGSFKNGIEWKETNSQYLPSSKVVPEYHKIDFNQSNIDICYDRYYQLLTKKIKI